MEEYKLKKCNLSSPYGSVKREIPTWEEIQKSKQEYLNELASDIAHYIYHLRVNKDTMSFHELYNGIENVDELVVKFQEIKDGYYTLKKDAFRWFSVVKPEIEEAILNSRVVLC